MLTMDFSSFWDILAIPFGYLMQGLNFICGNHYVLSLLLFAVVVKLVTLPFAIKQQKSQIKMAKLRPKLALIEKKYAGRTDRVTLQKKQQEQMELQQQEGYSPLSGCLPLLIQFPVIIALYRIIRYPLKYICNLSDKTVVELYNKMNPANTVEKFGKISDHISMVKGLRANPTLLDGTGLTVDKLPNFKVFGIDLAETPSFNPSDKINLWLLLIPFLCVALSYLTSWLSRKFNDNGMNEQQTPEQKRSMTIMMMTMPLMSLWISFITSGAVGLYWVYSSLAGLIQMLLLAKLMPIPKYTKEELQEIQRQMKKTGADPNRVVKGTRVDENGKPRSLHYDGDDTDQY